jgi:hypothetical protein
MFLTEERMSDEATPKAKAALAYAKQMKAQKSPAIWFDSWHNDLRDNNNDGKIDDPGEKASDGAHHGHLYSAKIAPKESQTINDVPAAQLKTIQVAYKVCIDIPLESYKAVGVPVPHTRWIPSFFAALKAIKGWKVWSHGQHPDGLLDGDIVAAANAAHQHAGIVETGFVFDSVINLPGPTSSQKYHMYNPSGTNDMVTVPRVLFESVLGIEFYARWTRT